MEEMRNLLGKRQLDGTPRHRSVGADVAQTWAQATVDKNTAEIEEAMVDVDKEFSSALSCHQVLQKDLGAYFMNSKDVNDSVPF